MNRSALVCLGMGILAGCLSVDEGTEAGKVVVRETQPESGVKVIEYDGLTVEPSLPAGIRTLKVHRIFRDAEYDITINISGKGGKQFIPYSPGKHEITINI